MFNKDILVKAGETMHLLFDTSNNRQYVRVAQAIVQDDSGHVVTTRGIIVNDIPNVFGGGGTTLAGWGYKELVVDHDTWFTFAQDNTQELWDSQGRMYVQMR